jgi:TonB-dependent receptor
MNSFKPRARALPSGTISRRLRQASALSLACLAGASALEAASIRGQVYDTGNALFIEGAQVTVEGTDRTVYSEGSGRFTIAGLEPGTYTVTTRSTGYPPVSRTVTLDAASDEETLTIELGSGMDVFELEAFEVVGAVSATVKALNIERSAADLREVVASDIFGQFVDRNPAEALQRVAGVTVEDDQGEGAFVIIRGASPDLSNVQLDGIELATPQPDGRRVNLNIITVDQLERIEVSKTWLPSQKGNTIGGTVNLVTRSALDRGRRFASAEFAWSNYDISDEDSYRGQVTFGDTIDSGDWEWLRDKAIGFQISASYSEDNRGSETLSFGYELDASYPFGGSPLYGYTIVNNRWRDYSITRERNAVSTKLELRLNDDHEFFLSASYNEFDDDEVQQFFSRSASTGNDFSYDGRNGEFLTEDAAVKLGYDLNNPDIIARLQAPPTSTTRRFTYQEALALGDIAYDEETRQFTFGSWTGGFSRNFDNEITSDELLTYQYGGRHHLFERMNLEWKLYTSKAERNTERLEFGFGGPGGIMDTILGDGLPKIDPSEFLEVSLNPSQYTVSEPASTSSGNGTLYEESFSFSEDERTGYAVDIDTEFELFGLSWKTLVGVAFDARDKVFSRDFNTAQIATGAFDDDLYPQNRLSLADEIFFGGESDGFVDNYGEFFQFGPVMDVDGLRRFVADPAAYGVTLTDEVEAGILASEFFNRLVSNYESSEDILGLYLQQSVRWRKWSLIFGARWEETENTFTNLRILTRDPESGRFINPSFWRFLAEDQYSERVTSRRNYDNFLPAVHLRRDIGDDMVFRASVTKTMARPRFDQLDAREIPSRSGSNFGTTIRLSNFEDIVPLESVNYDISLEKYFQPIGQVAVSLFYKDLDGPIYEERRLAVGPDDETREFAFRYDSRNGSKTGVDDPTLINSSPWTFNRTINAGDAELYGIEFSFSRRLDDILPEAFHGFSIEGNYAAFESEVELLAEERIRPRDRNGNVVEVDPTVPLFKQPDKTANLSLIFERWGVFARISYNLRGKYLDDVFVGDDVGNLLRFEDSPAALDRYVDDTERWDFTLRYNATSWLQVFVEVINFTNEPQVEYLGNLERPGSVRYTDPIYTVGLKVAL